MISEVDNYLPVSKKAVVVMWWNMHIPLLQGKHGLPHASAGLPNYFPHRSSSPYPYPFPDPTHPPMNQEKGEYADSLTWRSCFEDLQCAKRRIKQRQYRLRLRNLDRGWREMEKVDVNLAEEIDVCMVLGEDEDGVYSPSISRRAGFRGNSLEEDTGSTWAWASVRDEAE